MAIGRCIVRDPTAFLFDEPLSNLDAALRVEMRHEIAKPHQSLKSTMIYATHDRGEVMTLKDRNVVLEFGKIAQVGTPRELYERPANLFVAQFIGSLKKNILPCATKDGTYALAGGGDGVIDVIEHLGAGSFLVVDCRPLGKIVQRSFGDVSPREGDSVGLKFAAARLSFFDKEGLRV